MTKKLLHQEWAMDLDAAIEAEAEAQAICMQTADFRRAYEAFVAKQQAQVRGELAWTGRISTGRSSPTSIARSRRTSALGRRRRSTATDHADVDAVCRARVRALGAAGWLRYCVPAAHGGALAALDSRALCIARETLAYHDGLADFAFAMQGLGSGAITLAGQRRAEGALAARGGAGHARSPRSRCRSPTPGPTSRR